MVWKWNWGHAAGPWDWWRTVRPALSSALAPAQETVGLQNDLGSIGFAYVALAMDVTTVSPKFQVVIPKRVREQFGLSPGQTLQVIALPGRIALVPTQSPSALRCFLPGKNTFQRQADRL